MKRVYKYEIKFGDYITVDLPEDCEILTFDNQNEQGYIWALCDPDAPLKPRHFRMAGTGHIIDDNYLGYVGTAFFRGGDLIFHLFEVNEVLWQ